MKFQQGSAGNAHAMQAMRLGTPRTRFDRAMRRRSRFTLVLLTLAAVLALPLPAARASDPLLSGYAGPGSGEQVILGGGSVGGGNNGSGASGATARRSLSAVTPTSSGAPSGAASPSPVSAGGPAPQHHRKNSPSHSSSSTQKHNGGSSTSSSTSTSSTSTAAPAGAPRVVAYPTRAGAVSGFPLSASAVLLGILALVLLALAFLGLRRLTSGGPQEPSSMPQVSAH
jgi:hypothetical protein